MRKIVLLLALSTAIFSCKKESTNSPSSNTATDGKLGVPIKDIDGNTYQTVIIGSQQWMAENLKVTKYNDGKAIKNIEADEEWRYTDTAGWCYYDNKESNNAKHGKLYNWNVVNKEMNGNRNVCPVGWHVPSESDWGILGQKLGGVFNAGGKLKVKDTADWKSPSNGSNSSLFSAYPSGIRYYSGSFEGQGNVSLWWSSDEDIYNKMYAPALSIYYINNQFSVYNEFKYSGVSIRCIKD